MKESTRVALAYVKANCHKFSIDPNFFSKNDINIHVLEGATPKDGPSAGVALVSAIISALTGEIIPENIGMTGEITLHGDVKEIGGLKEKAIAAHRSELKIIIIPEANKKDIDDIPSEIYNNPDPEKRLKIVEVKSYEEV
jgi:ATP-dependent Lon protease